MLSSTDNLLNDLVYTVFKLGHTNLLNKRYDPLNSKSNSLFSPLTKYYKALTFEKTNSKSLNDNKFSPCTGQ